MHFANIKINKQIYKCISSVNSLALKVNHKDILISDTGSSLI